MNKQNVWFRMIARLALVLFVLLLLAGCSSKDALVPVVPEGAQAGTWLIYSPAHMRLATLNILPIVARSLCQRTEVIRTLG